MKYRETTALHKILAMNQRTRIIQGGSSAGKTIAILMVLIDTAQATKGKTISVVSETFPHLRKGAIKDFIDIMKDRHYYDDQLWNKSESTYNFESGSIIEFFSADQSGKVHGPRRDILFVNEANNISLDVYRQLALRTNDYIFIDYNPISEFYVHSDLIQKPDSEFIILTYKDNEGLPPTIVKELESHRENKNFWKVYGEGQLGEAEGLIYKNWKQIDEVPHEAKLQRYGLDFGYSNDPTAGVGIYNYNGGIILDEVIFQKGLSNRQIADIFLNLERALIVADSSEPKSIDEIKSYGLSIVAAQKGQGSVLQGIQYVQDQKISVTKRSVNLIKEQRNYLWLTDKDGKAMNEPSPIYNHLMDAVRYGLSAYTVQAKVEFPDEQLFTGGFY